MYEENEKIYSTLIKEEKTLDEIISENSHNLNYIANILKEIKERDYQDMNRATAPLKQAEDAVLGDTTEIGLEESIELMINTIKERL